MLSYEDNTQLIFFQCIQVDEKLFFSSKFIEKNVFSFIQFVKYINILIVIRYDTFRPNNFSLSSSIQNKSLFTSNEQPYEDLMNMICSFEYDELILYLKIVQFTS